MAKKKRRGGQRIPVIFRMFFAAKHDVFVQRDCIALFPTICADYTGKLCQSYVQLGQHGAADPHLLISCGRTRPATAQEYRELARELRKIGYRYVIRKRQQHAWADLRAAQAAQARKQVQACPAGLPWSPEARAEALAPA